MARRSSWIASTQARTKWQWCRWLRQEPQIPLRSILHHAYPRFTCTLTSHHWQQHTAQSCTIFRGNRPPSMSWSNPNSHQVYPRLRRKTSIGILARLYTELSRISRTVLLHALSPEAAAWYDGVWPEPSRNMEKDSPHSNAVVALSPICYCQGWRYLLEETIPRQELRFWLEHVEHWCCKRNAIYCNG